MTPTLDPELRRALSERVRYCQEMGIHDFYRRGAEGSLLMEAEPHASAIAPLPESELREEMAARKSAVVVEENILEIISPKPEHGVADPAAALRMIREDLGDCTRCKLHKQGRKQIVFGVGNPRAELMFIGEGPGADEDAQGRALCRSCRAVAQQHDQGNGPETRRCLHRQHRQVPSARQPATGARRM